MKWRRGRAVLGGFLVTAAGLQHDSLDTNVQGFQLLDDGLRHSATQFTRNNTQRSTWSVKVWKLTPAPMKGPQCINHSSEPVGGCRYEHQLLARINQSTE